MIFEYEGNLYPEYIRNGAASTFIRTAALHFCKGVGLDVGGGKWPLPGASSIDIINGQDAMSLPVGVYDYVFSSHCLEHLPNTVAALEHWKSRIRPGGVLFLYLPHPDMEYWRPQHCRKHLHNWWPDEMALLLEDLGFTDVIHSERDMYWSFCVVGFVPK